MSDRADYYKEVLIQTAAIANETGSIERVIKHLERHGFDGEENKHD